MGHGFNGEAGPPSGTASGYGKATTTDNAPSSLGVVDLAKDPTTTGKNLAKDPTTSTSKDLPHR